MLHRSLRLIGYIRTGGTEVSAEEQRRMMEEFCQSNDYRLVGVANADSDEPSYGLNKALQEAMQNDGLIALNLDRFVTHHDDRLLDLRPLLESFLRDGKVLIALLDGINTVTADGQEKVLLFLNKHSEDESLVAGTRLDAQGVKVGLSADLSSDEVLGQS